MTSKAMADTMPAGTTSGAPQVLLAHHLKQLRLPTVLREYDKVARECARDGVDHPRYLLRLIELELIGIAPFQWTVFWLAGYVSVSADALSAS